MDSKIIIMPCDTDTAMAKAANALLKAIGDDWKITRVDSASYCIVYILEKSPTVKKQPEEKSEIGFKSKKR